MNKAQHVAALFPSQAEMARVLERDPARVTRMLRAGRIPGIHNEALMAWAFDNGCEEEMSKLMQPLCPCCGKELT